ncbi:MAG: hypothetical protein JJU45_03065 [Acidimicrobiia bacterium]|nr:hypothetical protein [Acidimicrobiia bacterium]
MNGQGAGSGAASLSAAASPPLARARTLTSGDVRSARLAGALALVAALGGLLPWHRSGSVDRSGYEVVASAGRLGLTSEGFAAVGVALWFLVPAIAVAGVTLAVLGAVRSAASASAVAGAVSVGVSAVVLVAPGSLALGPLVTVVAGAAAATLAIRALLPSRSGATRVEGVDR